MAPEMLSKGRSYTNKVDMWSLGIVLFTCLAGFLPFCVNDSRSLESVILKCQYKMDHSLWKGISTHAKSLIKKLLVKDPKKRFGISETLNHQWLKDKKVISSVQNLFRNKEVNNKRKCEYPEEINKYQIYANKKTRKEDSGALNSYRHKTVQEKQVIGENKENSKVDLDNCSVKPLTKKRGRK